MLNHCSPSYYLNELTHHGVKGMKWGIRNKKSSAPSLKQKKANNENVKRKISSKNVEKALKIGAAIMTGVGVGALALANPTFSSAAMSVNAIMNAPVATLNLTNRVSEVLKNHDD